MIMMMSLLTMRNLINSAVRAIDEILSIAGLDGMIDMCCSCGLEGTRQLYTTQ